MNAGFIARKAEWALHWPDGNDKVVIKYDTTSQLLPAHIQIETSSDQWIYIDAADAAWIAARLLDAAEVIAKARGEA